MPGKLNRRRFLKQSAAMAAITAGGLSGSPTARAEEEEKEKDKKNGKWGDLVGKFVYDGEAPDREKLKVDKDLDCCGKFDIRDESLMVSKKGGLKNVFVYLRTRKVQVCPELEESVEESVLLDNLDCIFAPHCLTIWRGKQKLHIVNSDPVAQNVAFSPSSDVPANIVLPPPPHKSSKADWEFRRGQRVPVAVKCNYHPWESAYVLPLDNPYGAVTKADGTFRISKLPVGELEFQLWHEKVGYLKTAKAPKGRLSVTIRPGSNDIGVIKLAPDALKKKPVGRP